MMSKRKAIDLENSRQFVGELISEFICSPELYELSVETAVGVIQLRKYDNPRKMGFMPRSDKHE